MALPPSERVDRRRDQSIPLRLQRPIQLHYHTPPGHHHPPRHPQQQPTIHSAVLLLLPARQLPADIRLPGHLLRDHRPTHPAAVLPIIDNRHYFNLLQIHALLKSIAQDQDSLLITSLKDFESSILPDLMQAKKMMRKDEPEVSAVFVKEYLRKLYVRSKPLASALLS